GTLVAVYGLVVALTSVPLARVAKPVPRRYVLTVVLATLVLSTLVSAMAEHLAVLFSARIATALAQAMFWAVMAPAAVGLFRPEVRGRVVGVMFACGSLATVAGVPAGTWLGHHGDWRTPFIALAVLGLVALLLVGICLPTARPGSSHGDLGAAPDRRRYVIVLATTALSATGAFAAFTYVAPFLRDVAGFDGDGVSALLTLFGIGGLAGVLLVGAMADRHPRLVVAVPVTGQAGALAALTAFGGQAWVAAVGVLALGLPAAPVFAATQGRIMHVAPAGTDTASAANSAAFNLGIAAGGALGGVVLELGSVRQTFVVGTIISALASVVVWSEGRFDRTRAAPCVPGEA